MVSIQVMNLLPFVGHETTVLAAALIAIEDAFTRGGKRPAGFRFPLDILCPARGIDPGLSVQTQ